MCHPVPGESDGEGVASESDPGVNGMGDEEEQSE